MILFNKKLGVMMLLIGAFAQIGAMDWSSPSKRPRNEVQLAWAPSKKQRREPLANGHRKVSLFDDHLKKVVRQDEILRITMNGNAADISMALSQAQGSDIVLQMLENIFANNTSITEFQKIDLYKQLNQLGVNLDGPITVGSNTKTGDMNLLHIGADNNEPAFVRYVLKHSNIDPNVKAGTEGWTPVHFTTNPEVIRVLVRDGANPQIKDADGNSAADLITSNTIHDKKLKVCLATYGVFPQFSTSQEKEELAKMTCHTVAQTIGTPLVKLVMDRQIKQRTPSFYNAPIMKFGSVMVDNDGSSSDDE